MKRTLAAMVRESVAELQREYPLPEGVHDFSYQVVMHEEDWWIVLEWQVRGRRFKHPMVVGRCEGNAIECLQQLRLRLRKVWRQNWDRRRAPLK